MLDRDDRLIIYFAGHGYNTAHSNFFVPYDGSKDNFISCIPSSYISKSVIDLHSTSAFVFFDLKLSLIQFKEYENNNKTYFNSLKTFRKKETSYFADQDRNSLYNDFMKSFFRRSPNRIKDAFCFVKDMDVKREYGMHNLVGNLISSYNKLGNILQDEYAVLNNLIKKELTQQVLEKLKVILENNDADLYSRVETLLFKLDEIEKVRNADKLQVRHWSRINNISIR